jgi:hypothetical protein
MGQKRPKLLRLPVAKSATEQRVKFVPNCDVSAYARPNLSSPSLASLEVSFSGGQLAARGC